MKSTVYPLLAAFLCGLTVFFTLNFPESAGFSNNGDFLRVISPSRIGFADNNPNQYVYTPYFQILTDGGDDLAHAAYRFLVPDYSRFKYVTSQTAVILLSKIMNLAANLAGGRSLVHYSLIWLGFLYTVIFSFSLYLIYKFLYKRFGLGMFICGFIIGLLVFCGQAYTLYFNSFFGEAMQYTATFLSAGLFLHLPYREKHVIPHYGAYYISVAFMAASKFAYAPIGILFALLPIIYAAQGKIPRGFVITVSSVSAVLFLTYFQFGVPNFIQRDTAFNSVFSGVIKFSREPETDLADMGFEPSLSVLQGMESYQDSYPLDIESDEFQQMFHDKFSKFNVIKFYLTHPGRFWDAMKYTAQYSNYIRPTYLPSVLRPEGDNNQSERFSWWEPIRIGLPLHRMWFIIPFLTAMLFISVKSACRMDALGFIGIVLVMACVFNFITPYMGNGICDIAKHLFGYIHLFDILLFSGVTALFYNLVTKLKGNTKRDTNFGKGPSLSAAKKAD